MIRMKNRYYLLAFLLFLQGCSKYNPEDALHDLNKANNKQPLTTAKFVNEKFPCNIKSDTIVNTKIEYKYMDVICPPADSLSLKDTVYIDKVKVVQKNNIVKRIVALPSKTITITKYYEDSAKIKELALVNSQTISELKGCTDGKEKAMNWNKWLIICLACSIILNIIQLRK